MRIAIQVDGNNLGTGCLVLPGPILPHDYLLAGAHQTMRTADLSDPDFHMLADSVPKTDPKMLKDSSDLGSPAMIPSARSPYFWWRNVLNLVVAQGLIPLVWVFVALILASHPIQRDTPAPLLKGNRASIPRAPYSHGPFRVTTNRCWALISRSENIPYRIIDSCTPLHRSSSSRLSAYRPLLSVHELAIE